MAAILEVNYFNSFWTKKQRTGEFSDVKGDASPSGWSPVVPGLNGSGSKCYPGPVAFGDSQTGLNLQDAGGFYSYDSPWNQEWPTGATSALKHYLALNYFIEDSRIKGLFNAVNVDYGVKAYVNLEDPVQRTRSNALIYSGPYNSLNNFNETNVFSTGENITKAVDPIYGSVQKLHSDDTNLIILQENKSSYALIDKDAIYSAEGAGTPVTSTTVVIGQIVPYLGEYGISQNPESFATFGFQKYYIDKDRSAVMRLSRDGLTEISQYGMLDYFRDELAKVDNNFKLYDTLASYTPPIASNTFTVNNPDHALEIGSKIFTTTDGVNYTDTNEFIVNVVDAGGGAFNITSTGVINSNYGTIKFSSYKKGLLLGGYDIYSKHYAISMQLMPAFYSTDRSTYQTLSFDEQINGWVSRYTFKPTALDSLENTYYTMDKGVLYQQFDDSVPNRRGYFYDQPFNKSTVKFIMNGEPTTVKVFQTIGYEGSSGWEVSEYYSDEEGPDYINASYENYDDETKFVYSYLEGKYEVSNPVNTGTAAITPPYAYAGFNRKENKYVTNLVQKTTTTSGTITYPPRPGEVIFGSVMSGIKGYYSTVVMSTDNVTEVGGMKELFSVSSNVIKSS